MKIIIDPNVCTGHGLCYAVAKTLVHYDERGYGVVIHPELELDPSKMDEAKRAVLSCPEQAVSIVED
jgi:ferredoxin